MLSDHVFVIDDIDVEPYGFVVEPQVYLRSFTLIESALKTLDDGEIGLRHLGDLPIKKGPNYWAQERLSNIRRIDNE